MFVDDDQFNNALIEANLKKVAKQNTNSIEIKKNADELSENETGKIYNYNGHAIMVYFLIDALTAVQNFDISTFYLIMTDINMPNMDGFEFINYIQSHSNNTTILVLTSSIDQTDIKRVRNHGVSQFMVKPITKDRLKQLLDEFFPLV